MRRPAIAVPAALAAFAVLSASAGAATWETAYVKRTHTYSDLQQLIALGESDGWAIDGNGRLLRRDASGWKRAPQIEPTTLARGADGSAWAFGTTRRAVHAWRFDGASWVDRADRARDSFVLDAAAIADNDVWVTSAQPRGTRVSHRVRHWDGSSWRTVPTPLPLQRLAAVAADDVWATGDRTGRDGAQPGIVHWAGLDWGRSVVPRIALPKPITTTLGGETTTHRPEAELNDIAARSATDVWAVGNVITRLCCDDRVYGREIVLHFDGGEWRRVDLDLRGVELRSVAADPVGGVWIAANPFGGKRRPFLLNLRGGRWTRTTLPPRPRERDVAIKAITAVPGTPEVWTFAENGLRTPAGTQDNENLIYRYR